MYAKLIDGVLCLAPHTVTWKEHIVNNPSSSKLLDLGYLPVTYTEMPADAPNGKHYKEKWEQTDTTILQTWELVDNSVMLDEELTAEEALSIIIGELE